MKKRYLFLVLFVLTGIVMYQTDPPLEQHQEAVYKELAAVLDEELKDDANAAMLKDIDPKMIEQLARPIVAEAVSVDDYKVFSLTKVRVGDQVHPVGIGVFSKVFIAPQLRSAVKEEIGKYKGLYPQ